MSLSSLAASSGLCRMRYSRISSITPVAIGTDSCPTGSWLSGGGVAWLAAGPSSKGVICSLGELIGADSMRMSLWVNGVGLSLGIESRSSSPSLSESNLWEDRAALARGTGGAYRRWTAVALDLPEALESGRSERSEVGVGDGALLEGERGAWEDQDRSGPWRGRSAASGVRSRCRCHRHRLQRW